MKPASQNTLPIKGESSRNKAGDTIAARAQTHFICDKLLEHKRYIHEFGEELLEIRNWKWGRPRTSA